MERFEKRGFIHKRILGAASNFVTSGFNPLSAAAGFAAGGGGAAPAPSVMRSLAIPSLNLPCIPGLPCAGGATAVDCPPGTVPDGRGGCMSADPRARPGSQGGFGDASMGQFGAGLSPAVFTTTTRRCPRGAVLGSDGLCYNRRDISNGNRMWPRGRRPLLTGGEMRCISIAASAAKKLGRKQKQLQAMGMLPKPRRASSRRVAAGHHAHQAHD